MSGMYRCRRCGRDLKNPKSVEAGIGPVCAHKEAAAEGFEQREDANTLPLDLETMDIVLARQSTGQRMLDNEFSLVARTNVPWTVIQHSPDGFEWGYGGSGPAELALNILQLFTYDTEPSEVKCYKGRCTPTAWRLHQNFKWQFIAPMPRMGGTIRGAEIKAWIQAQPTDEQIVSVFADHFQADMSELGS